MLFKFLKVLVVSNLNMVYVVGFYLDDWFWGRYFNFDSWLVEGESLEDV